MEIKKYIILSVIMLLLPIGFSYYSEDLLVPISVIESYNFNQIMDFVYPTMTQEDWYFENNFFIGQIHIYTLDKWNDNYYIKEKYLKTYMPVNTVLLCLSLMTLDDCYTTLVFNREPFHYNDLHIIPMQYQYEQLLSQEIEYLQNIKEEVNLLASWNPNSVFN